MYALEDVNRMDRATFVSAFGDVAEHSPWVAERAFAFTPFSDRAALIAAFAQAMEAAGEGEQLALIRAHPDLAGKAARAGAMADASKREQAGAGLDTLTDAEFERFTRLNDSYREHFGFPFIFAVRGATKDMILEAFDTRLLNTPEEELATALSQIARIFRFRLEDLIPE